MVIGIVALAAALGIVFWNYRKQRRLMDNLNRMLDKAMEGSFTEADFDESLLSALETRLARYLATSALSAGNVRAEKEKLKRLIGDISHQTQTPIANILLYTQLLQEQPLGEEARICADALEGQTGKLKGLIEALVKTSRLESGVLAFQPQEQELAAVIASAVAQLMPKARQKAVELTVGSTGGSAVFDAKWTEEALFNLLDNAVKYAPAGGSVRVETKEYPMFTAIQVSDNGPGIPEEEQAKIFGRFYRGTAHGQEEGVGIGLYLVRQIAQGQGGYVKVSSKPGQGSRFSLFLPNTK